MTTAVLPDPGMAAMLLHRVDASPGRRNMATSGIPGEASEARLVAASPLVWAGGVVKNTSVGFTPLDELGTGTYLGQEWTTSAL